MRRRARALLNQPSRGKTDSVEALRRTWSHYAQEWDRRPDLNVGVETLGDEWGVPAFAERIVDELIAQYLGADVDVLELGCGGGKFSALLRARARRLVCADISPDMLARARVHVGDGDDVEYHRLNGRDFAGVPDRSVDMIFSYDVLLHLQPQNIFSYLRDARRILRPRGIFMLHAINLASPGGSDHFEDQYVHETWRHTFDDLRRLGHIYFMSEDQLRALAALARFSVDRMVTGWPPPGDPMHEVTLGRDTFGFLRREDGIQEQAAEGGVRLVRAPDEQLFAIVGGRRRLIRTAEIVEHVGLSLDDLEPIDAAELAAVPLDEPVSRWETTHAERPSTSRDR
jgi:SAM-dependent methyltransferase